MVLELRPFAPSPKIDSNALGKSLPLNPFKYNTGSKLSMFGDFLKYGGKIVELNLCSGLLSLILGASTSIWPAPEFRFRLQALP